jgi:muconolactone D-isomerase
MEFLIEFNLDVPEGTPEAEVDNRTRAEAVAAAELAREGHLVRVWNATVAAGETKVLGLSRADSPAQLDDVLRGLPLYELDARDRDPARAACQRLAETGATREQRAS